MKLRWKIATGLTLLLTSFVGLWLWHSKPDTAARNEAEATRRLLRKQGYKLDLSEFENSIPSEVSKRISILTNIGRTLRVNVDFPLSIPIGSNTALVIWKKKVFKRSEIEIPWHKSLPESDISPARQEQIERMQSFYDEDMWPQIRTNLSHHSELLNTASAVILSGPLQTAAIVKPDGYMLLPHTADVRNLAKFLACHAVLDLHEGNPEKAWQKLLAVTHLTVHWQPEATDIAHLVRFKCASLAFQSTWQALQAEWSDEQLLQLQKLWESADFFLQLPQTAAFSRASMTSLLRYERTTPFSWGSYLAPVSIGTFLQSPFDMMRMLYGSVLRAFEGRQYKKRGSYWDETSLLLYYQNQEDELNRAITNDTWQAMQAIPSARNVIPFHSKIPARSQVQSIMNLQQIARGSGSANPTLLGRASEAETKRRIVLTALALQRYRLRYGEYPVSLNALVPEFLQSVPFDFVDGKPLRFQKINEKFILYSVGLDGVDNGGKQFEKHRPVPNDLTGTDLVWPRPIEEP